MRFIKANRNRVLLAIISLIVAGIVVLYADRYQMHTPVSVATPAAKAPEVAHEARADTPIQSGTVKTYPQAVKRKLHLPPQVQADAAKQVLDASHLPADNHPQTVTTVIDSNTGATETYVRRDPLPLFAVDLSGEAGLYAGYRNGAPALRADIRQGLFAVKAVHIGGIVSWDQPIGGSPLPPTSFIGGGVWGHW